MKGVNTLKVMTILGTRPEVIRLSLIIRKLDVLADKHILVHTGQNYDRYLSDIFFEEMKIRNPDYKIHLSSYSFGQQVGQMFAEIEKIISKEEPDRILVLGDTNSALCAVLGERMGIPVYHMEAGNRCNDTTVPEEINRKVIDSISSYNLPYTSMSRENLLREGIPSHRIWVSGNPIYEVLAYYKKEIDQRNILQIMGIEKGKYILVTTHRAENVSNKHRLEQIVEGLHLLAQRIEHPIICSVHPRTRDAMMQFGIKIKDSRILFSEPFGFFDFIKLQQHALCVITDSGTVQEESCLFGVPAVTIRQSTERPETIVCGSNIISGLEAKQIADCVERMILLQPTWTCPEGYEDPNVSTKILNFVLGGLSYV